MTSSLDVFCASTSKRRRPTNKSSLDDMVDELLTEIFIRLPQDSVHRCKSISKRFHSLISLPCFVHQYAIHQQATCQRPCLLYHYSNFREDTYGVVGVVSDETPPPSVIFSFNFLPIKSQEYDEETLKLEGSCSGLLLVSCLAVEPTARPCPLPHLPLYYICNPLTKQWLELPPPPATVEIVDGFSTGYFAGFLCDNTQYKVVVFRKQADEISDMEIYCFCSESGSWSQRHVRVSDVPRDVNFTNMVACNGMLYWLDFESPRKIFAYDPCQNPTGLTFIDLPENEVIDDISPRDLNITENQGKIHLCLCRIGEDDEFINEFISLRVWELEDLSQRRWSSKHQIQVGFADTIVSRNIPYFNVETARYPGENNFRFLGFVYLDEHTAYVCLSKYIFLWNIKKKTLEVVFHLQHRCHGSIKGAFPFVLPSWPTPVPGFPKQHRVV